MFYQPMDTQPATLGFRTKIGKELMEMPPPSDKIITAVYKFRDQTGQYKPSETGASWSTAVTQGATSILLRALQESGWFVVIEREGLSNLLNERKIIRQSRAYYDALEGNEPSSLPPLLFAGVILEGGIISYNTNILTGGAGAKYFGIGASGQYRQDRVTIYLRAISTSNGNILKTVYTSKTILSQAIDVGFYRFVEFNKLLEAELGYTYNEPMEVCVTEAIEKAVQSLIIEGVMENLWTLKNEDDLNSPIFQRYMAEKDETMQSNLFGYPLTDQRTTIGIGLNVGTQLYEGDYPDGRFRPQGEVTIQSFMQPFLSLGMTIGYGELREKNNFKASMSYLKFNANYYLYPRDIFTPYLSVGAGFYSVSAENERGDQFESSPFGVPAVFGGIGFEYMATKQIGLNLLINGHYSFSDIIDGVNDGEYYDYFWGGYLGVNIYPF